MELEVRLFGVLVERAGSTSVKLALPDDATAADVVRLAGERYSSAAPLLGSVKVAVNLEVVPLDHAVRDTDEVALLPPTSGGSVRVLVGLRERPDVNEALGFVSAPEAGGTVVFRGTVRSPSDGKEIEALEYTAYEEMATKVMGEIAGEGATKWGLHSVAILHAVGTLARGETTFVVACSAPHRDEAFEACRYVVDEVKHRVPVWKRERGSWGERWIEG